MGGLPAVKGFLETSFIDWPGKVASVVFLPRCNYRCPYCHNHQLVNSPESYRSWDLEEIFEKLEALRGWVDGVCVTGGEPTIHPELPALLREFKKRGWPVKLDTNGSNPALVNSLIDEGLVDSISLDIKAPLEEIPYRRNTGKGGDPAEVTKTLSLIALSNIPLEVRTTVHPALLSFEECLRLSRQVDDITDKKTRIKWQLCKVGETLDPALGDMPAPDEEEFGSWIEKIEEDRDLRAS